MTVQSRYEERDNMKMCKFTRYDSRTSPASRDGPRNFVSWGHSVKVAAATMEDLGLQGLVGKRVKGLWGVEIGNLAKKDSVYDYVECYYRFDFFQKAYESLILPIPALGKGLGTNGSANDAVLPPITKRPTERPLMKRIKAFGEGTRPLKCSQCSVAGHNKKTCKAVI
ncbi:PREDICTED: PHAVU_003G122100g [Prunus dulcis]|uniref:PREDICTED: PHAVU_003G122100g n=1 Tax=Prunus dulcis TaxID=3755 RepID=A0A5E4FNC6_PRUDU|nr:PREDICTED: PHAVU_003G122100g [Prunus dulcis]